MTINGENKFLRITLGNLMTIATTIALLVGFYYKIDGRVAQLESRSAPTNLTERVGSLERKIDEQSPKLNNIARDVAWLVAREPNAPK